MELSACRFTMQRKNPSSNKVCALFTFLPAASQRLITHATFQDADACWEITISDCTPFSSAHAHARPDEHEKCLACIFSIAHCVCVITFLS